MHQALEYRFAQNFVQELAMRLKLKNMLCLSGDGQSGA